MSNALVIKSANIPFLYEMGRTLFFTVEISFDDVLQVLTGWTFRYVISCKGCDILFEATLDDYLSVIGTGLVRVNIPPEQLNGLPLGNKGCIHGFEATDSDGIVWPIFSGEIETIKNPTPTV